MAKITIFLFFAAICSGLAVRFIEVDGVETVIARKGSARIENTKIINVRVTSRLAAIQQTVTTARGKEVTLSCATVNCTPLSYCRFEPPPPAGKNFSIDSDATPEKALLQRYYFPPNKSLDRGDCAVSIRKVEDEDVGRWTCRAGLDDGQEQLDFILMQLEGYTLSEEMAIAFGAIGIVAVIILGFVHQLQTQRPRIPIITIQPPTPILDRREYSTSSV